MIFQITYDLTYPGQNYDDLYDEIKSLSNSYIHPCESNWFIDSDYSAKEIRNKLKAIDATDKLIVVAATAPGAWSGLDSSDSEWLRKNL